MDKDTIKPDQKLESENIFEDFTSDDSLWEEIKTHEEEKKKDVFFYMAQVGGVLKVLNALWFLALGILFVYIYIQNTTSPTSYTILKPVCNLFIGEAESELDTCYSVSYYLWLKQDQIESEKVIQTKKIGDIIGDIYLVDNFIYSQVVSFLVNSTENSLRPVEILGAFDKIKNTYEPIDKSKITCSNIVITDPGIFESRCEAYSSDWDSEILEVQNGILSGSDTGGTSVSVASSFIDYIDSDPTSPFTVLDKQKVFFATNVTGKGIYTKKTPFTLRLRYDQTDRIDF